MTATATNNAAAATNNAAATDKDIITGAVPTVAPEAPAKAAKVAKAPEAKAAKAPEAKAAKAPEAKAAKAPEAKNTAEEAKIAHNIAAMNKSIATLHSVLEIGGMSAREVKAYVFDSIRDYQRAVKYLKASVVEGLPMPPSQDKGLFAYYVACSRCDCDHLYAKLISGMKDTARKGADEQATEACVKTIEAYVMVSPHLALFDASK